MIFLNIKTVWENRLIFCSRGHIIIKYVNRRYLGGWVLMSVYDVLSLVIGSIWMPISINILVDKKLGVLRRLICALIVSFAFGTTLVVQYSEISTIWVFPICLLTVYFGMGRSIKQLLYVPISYIIVVISNYLVEVVLQSAGITDDRIQKELLFTNVLFLGITLVVIAITYIIKLIISFYMRSVYGTVSKEISILLVCNIILCAMVYLINGWAVRKMGFPNELKKVTMIIFFLYALLTVVITLFTLRIIRSQEKIKREQEEKKNLLEYTNQVESMYEELRSFKHDYVNILASLSGYIESEDMNGLKNYFEQNILPTNERIDQGKYHLQKLSGIKDPAIKGLVSSKMIYAMNAGLDVFIDIMESVDDIAIKVLDLTRILGIYIDNAIEAALESKQKEIKFNIVKEKNAVVIVVMNSFVNHNLSVKEMEKKNISTKGDKRGLGLNNVNEILQKYPNINKMTELKDDYFLQTLIIQNQ